MNDIYVYTKEQTGKSLTEASSNIEQAGKHITCERGCSYCCYQPIEVVRYEVVAVIHFLYQNPLIMRRFIENMYRYRKILLENADRFADADRGFNADCIGDIEAYLALDIPCPFLRGGVCIIHDVKPLTCAGFFSLSPVIKCKQKDGLSELYKVAHKGIPVEKRCLPDAVYYFLRDFDRKEKVVT
jgi:Fe-S-cluster containining protein